MEKITNKKEIIIFLKRVFLNNLINECLLIVEKNKISVTAIDMSNSVFLSCCTPIVFLPIGKYGIGDINLLIKFLEISKENEISAEYDSKHNLIIFKRNKNKLRYLLKNPDSIPTSVEIEKVPITKLKNKIEYSIPIEESLKKEISFYSSLVGIKIGSLSITKKSEVILKAGSNKEHQFSIIIGKVKSNKEISITFNLEYFLAIINELSFENKEEPTIEFKNNTSPIIINQNKKNIWALSPITLE